MRCKKCNSENITVIATMVACMPFDFYHHLTKKKMQSKDFKFGVDWADADLICKECGHNQRKRGMI